MRLDAYGSELIKEPVPTCSPGSEKAADTYSREEESEGAEPGVPR